MNSEEKHTIVLLLKNKTDSYCNPRVLVIETALPDDQIIPAIRAASNDYLSTPEGKAAWLENGQSFDYGCFAAYVGNKFCEPRGFVKRNGCNRPITLDIDEPAASLEQIPSLTDDGNGIKDDLFCIIQLDGTNAVVTCEDVDAIIQRSLYGNAHWCAKEETVGELLGIYGHEQISKGGAIRFFPYTGNSVDLTPTLFQKGLALWIKNQEPLGPIRNILINGGINLERIYTEEADAIIQYALFGKQIYNA